MKRKAPSIVLADFLAILTSLRPIGAGVCKALLTRRHLVLSQAEGGPTLIDDLLLDPDLGDLVLNVRYGDEVTEVGRLALTEAFEKWREKPRPPIELDIGRGYPMELQFSPKVNPLDRNYWTDEPNSVNEIVMWLKAQARLPSSGPIPTAEQEAVRQWIEAMPLDAVAKLQDYHGMEEATLRGEPPPKRARVETLGSSDLGK